LRNGKDLGALRNAADKLPVEEHTRAELDRLARGGVHQGVVLEVDEVPIQNFDEWKARAFPADALFVVLDGVEDPHNFGAIVRTACACGAHAVIFAEDRSAPVSPVAVKSAAGAMEYVALVRARNLNRAVDALRESFVTVASLDAHGDVPLWEPDYSGPTALVVGSEGKGIRRSILNKSDRRVRIPTPGPMPSLNASVAAAVALAEILRQRTKS
jgi:23S rRNA (guanosine2251-2'-O)-methyltransferase